MLFFYSSHKNQLRPIGSHILRCQTCEQEQPHVLYHNIQEDSLYSVKVKDTLLQRVSFCDICGTATRTSRSEVIATAPFWTVDTPLSKIADDTDYVLIDPSCKPVCTNTISKMLHAIAHNKVSQDTKIVGTDIIISIITAFGFYGIYQLVDYYIKAQNPLHAIIAVLIGLFFGLLGSICIRYRRIATTARRSILILQMEKLRLTIDGMRMMLNSKTLEDSKIKHLLEQVSKVNKLHQS